jgi:hypothetical protein
MIHAVERFLFYKKPRGPNFVGGLHKVKHLFKWGQSTKLAMEGKLNFGKMCGHKVPMKVSYHELFRVCEDPNALVVDLVEEGVWGINFRRKLNEGQWTQWREQEERMPRVSLSMEEDTIVWALEKGGVYTVKSLYRHLSFGGVVSRRIRDLCATKIPLKIKIFPWQMFYDKLQTSEQLKKENGKGRLLVDCVARWRM